MFIFRELNDNLAGDAIEGEIPQLLRGILAQDPTVFKAGSSYNAINSTGKKIHLSLGICMHK